MSLWSFQGARELEAPALHEAAPQRGSVPQNSTACGRLPREPTRETRSTSSRRTGSSDDAEHELEPSTSPAASGTATLLRLHPNHRPHLRRLPPQKGLAHRLRVLPTFVV